MKLKHTEFYKARYERAIILFERIWLLIDLSNWVFPLALHITCVGNNNRIYTISLDFLCFRIICCVDEDSY